MLLSTWKHHILKLPRQCDAWKGLSQPYQLVHSVWYNNRWCNPISWFNMDDFATSDQVKKKSTIQLHWLWFQMDNCLKICWVPVRALTAILHYQLKNETGIKISITATSKLFGTQEKLLLQALKGVHYESGLQKCRWEDAAHDKQEDSSSSGETNDDDDDDNDEGAVTRIKLLKKKHKKWCETTDVKWELWHWSSLIVTVFLLGPLCPPVPLCIPNFQIFLSRLLFHIFEPSCPN